MISFIIPAYNEEALIGLCIDSIKREINRFGCVAEIIVVDNLSTDRTAAIATERGARVIECRTKGVTHARQAGFLAASWGLHAYIDADNILPDGWLDNVYALWHNQVVAISGPPYFYEESTIVTGLAALFFQLQRVAHRVGGASLQGGNFIVKRDALIAIGGHSTNIEFFGEDTDLAARLSKVGIVRVVPAMWIYSSSRRLRAQGVVRTAWTYTINYLSVSIFGRPATIKYSDFRGK
jgi:glycosyltransferase involved in cell wall biosynthesis